MVNAALHLSCMTHTHKCTAPNPHAQDSLCVACACMPCAFELRCVTWHSCHMHECNAIQGARHMPAHTRTHTHAYTHTHAHTHTFVHTYTHTPHACLPRCHVTLPLDIYTEVAAGDCGGAAPSAPPAAPQPNHPHTPCEHAAVPSHSFLKALSCGMACLEHKLATASAAFVATK